LIDRFLPPPEKITKNTLEPVYIDERSVKTQQPKQETFDIELLISRLV
jgi:hypothetical protein